MKIVTYSASIGMVAVAAYFMMMCECPKKDHLEGHLVGDRYKSISMTSLTGKSNVIPIAVIGSGPAGSSAGTYGGRSKHRTVIFEGPRPGGLLMDTTMVDNWPGSPSAMGPDIMEGLRLQAEKAGAMYLPYTVASVDLSSWPYTLTTDEGLVFHALSIVIATGATPRTLGIPGEKEYWGHGVTACAVCDAPFFKDEEVVVIGGGDSAVEQAIQLAPYAKKITVLIRKNRMRAAQSMQDRLKNYEHISLRYHVDVTEVVGNGKEVTGVKIYNNKTESEEFLPANGVFLAIGHNPNSSLFKDKLECEFDGYIRTMSKSQETSVAGVFAAGEVEDNHYRQAGVAAGRGIMAALDAIAFLSSIGYDLKMADKVKSQLVRKEDFEQTVAPEVSEIEDYAQFEALSEGHPDSFMFIDFFAEYCSDCMAMLPVYAAVADEYQAKALFYKVDAGAHLELAQEFQVSKVPCLLVYKGGNLVARFVKSMNKQELTDFVEKHINA